MTDADLWAAIDEGRLQPLLTFLLDIQWTRQRDGTTSVSTSDHERLYELLRTALASSQDRDPAIIRDPETGMAKGLRVTGCKESSSASEPESA